MTENDWIHKVVEAFYDKAKIDILIGYHFRNIKDFHQHIPRIVTFWEFQLLGNASRETGEPFDLMRAHIPLGIKRGELGRWLVLFRQTLEQELQNSPEMLQLKLDWDKKLEVFEGIFLRFFRF